jgi:cell division protein ZapE
VAIVRAPEVRRGRCAQRAGAARQSAKADFVPLLPRLQSPARLADTAQRHPLNKDSVLDLGSVLAAIPARPDPDALVAGFVPPPRFAAKRFDNYAPDARHPSQTAALRRLREVAGELSGSAGGGGGGWLRRAFGGKRPAGSGVYLDGGFGVGKTHLLAALWHAAPQPSAYLSFDELVYTIGLLGVEGTRAAFRGRRLVAVDEWELDDPGNLKMALAFLRGALEDGVRVATTSNTIPDELGRGRFDQKNFRAEIEELSSRFEVLEIEGDDYRHRRFQADPGRAYFLGAGEMEREIASAGERALLVSFPDLLAGLGEVHPIRYTALVERVDALLVTDVAPFAQLYDGLRWVHFIDKLYDGAVPLAATSTAALGELFPASFLTGPYGKKFSRCLSRMEEMLKERAGDADD